LRVCAILQKQLHLIDRLKRRSKFFSVNGPRPILAAQDLILQAISIINGPRPILVAQDLISQAERRHRMSSSLKVMTG